MAKIGVDPACYDLARHFLTDITAAEPISDEEIKHSLTSLAETIQRAVEDWCEAQNWEPWQGQKPPVDPRDPDHSREGIFVYHNCGRCDDGEKPCVEGKAHGVGCSWPHARND